MCSYLKPAIVLALLSLSCGVSLAQETEKPTAETQEPVAVAAASAPGVVISGVIEANYTFNLNSPHTRQNYNYFFNRREGQFALNLAEIQVAKAATPASRAGFVVKLIEGEVKRFNFITPDVDSANILEAYGTYLIPIGTKDLKFDAGQFETHVGYETVEIGTNNFFSHNYLFGIPAPFYNAGVRASYPISNKLTLNGYIYNRYNGRTDDNNRDIAPGFQLAYAISPSSSLVFNALGSRENLADIGFGPAVAPATSIPRQQTVLDLIYTNQANATTKFVFEGLYRTGKDVADETYNFAGGALYGIFGPVGLRVEYMADTKNTFLLGPKTAGSTDKSSIGSATLSYEPRTGLFPGARTILEARYDFSNAEVFAKEDTGDFGKNQFTITLGQVYSF
ncbi:MAG: outer membrane beta-barrel protein [Armatimonadetes bacterium]|nr:outer membrane beta-barrel protein [Armatimonadota bacterium]